MDTHRQNNGLQTFLEHWGFLLLSALVLLTAHGLMFFSQLTRSHWIALFATSFALMFVGGCLIGGAKIPVYRSGRFFAFGLKSVPEPLRGSYRWGWRLFLFGAGLALWLAGSQP